LDLRLCTLSCVTLSIWHPTTLHHLSSSSFPYTTLFRSHGFRPGRSCHTALKLIKKSWTGCKWLVEVDVRGFFDNIDHDILLGLRSEEHTSELQSRFDLVCRLLLEKKKRTTYHINEQNIT